MLKLKDRNDILEDLIDASLRQLSKEYSKESGEPHLFEYWSNTRATDKDKNLCFQAVLDVRKMQPDGKIISFKRVYDRWLVQRANIGTIDEPNYGKQTNMEEHRNTCLREVLGKSIATFTMGMALRSKEQIQELYAEAEDTEVNQNPLSLDEVYEKLDITQEDVDAYENQTLGTLQTEGQTYSEAKED